MKTLFLSNADLKETIDLLRVVLGARRVAPGARRERAHDQRHARTRWRRPSASSTIVDKRRAEVVVEVQILEVARNKLKEYGIYLTSGLDAQGIEGIASGDLPRPDDQEPERRALRQGQPRGHARCPGAVVRLLETDSSTRLLANPQLRVSEGQTAQARFGDQVPVPGHDLHRDRQRAASPQQPITSFEYKNVGVNIDITPRVAPRRRGHAAAQARHLRGGRAGLPGPADLQQPHRQLDDPPARRRDQHARRASSSTTSGAGLTGLPGLASIPFIGRLFASNKDEATADRHRDDADPARRSGGPRSSEADLRSFLVGGETSPFLFDVPARRAATPPPAEPPASSRSARPRPRRLEPEPADRRLASSRIVPAAGRPAAPSRAIRPDRCPSAAQRRRPETAAESRPAARMDGRLRPGRRRAAASRS